MTGLLTALAAVQADAPPIPKDKTNPHFGSKFAGLDTIVEKIGPVLSKHGLVWVTLPTATEHGPALEYRLAHAETGEAITGTMPLLLGKADSQGLGSAITYARRYALCAVLNLIADDDDDGNAASSSSKSRPSRSAFDDPSDKQLGRLKRDLSTKKPSKEQLRVLLDRAGCSHIQVEDGWTKKLSRRAVSSLIDSLTEPLPDVEHPSDLSYGEPAPEVESGAGVTHLGGEAA